MNNLRNILKEEYRKYPLMEMDDFIKLIYQHVNGGNHLIKDEKMVYDYLIKEYEEVEEDKDIPLYEDIGNDIYRINIARLKHEKLSISTLFHAFIKSAKMYTQNIEKMEEAFIVLKELIEGDKIHLSLKQYEEFLRWYRDNNYPVISHSKRYNAEYHPHYRIVNHKYLNEIINNKEQ